MANIEFTPNSARSHLIPLTSTHPTLPFSTIAQIPKRTVIIRTIPTRTKYA